MLTFEGHEQITGNVLLSPGISSGRAPLDHNQRIPGWAGGVMYFIHHSAHKMQSKPARLCVLDRITFQGTPNSRRIIGNSKIGQANDTCAGVDTDSDFDLAHGSRA